MASQPVSQPHPLKCQQQSRLNYSRMAHTIDTRDAPGALAQVTRDTVPLGLTKHLLFKATLPRLGNGVNLPNT